MNHITLHGKVVKKAKTVLVTVNNKPDTVTVFTVVDIGLPYKRMNPVFIQVNYRKDAASLIDKYLVENKEVLIEGRLCQRYRKSPDGQKTSQDYLEAENVMLLPQFSGNEQGEQADDQ